LTIKAKYTNAKAKTTVRPIRVPRAACGDSSRLKSSWPDPLSHTKDIMQVKNIIIDLVDVNNARPMNHERKFIPS
jgi:hypothetical protein